MGHFQKDKSRFEATPPEWLPIGSQIGEVVNGWSKRGDIIAYVGEGAGAGIAAACFRPDIAEMEVNVDAAFGEGADPTFIADLRDRDNQFDYPAAMGAVLHEAMHARHSLFSLEALARHKDRGEAALAEWFEETRIENRGVAHYPENRSFLRACALKLSIGDISEDEDLTANGAMGLSKLMLLSLARVDAGVLEPDDVKTIRDKAADFFGEPLLEKLRKIWIRAQAHSDDTDWEPLTKLGREWLDLLEENGHKTKPDELTDEEKQALGDLIKEMMGDMVEAAEATETDAHDEANEQATREMWARIAEEQNKASKEDKEAKDTASEVFGKGTGPSAARHTSSKLVEKRPPTGPERAAAVTVARMLEKARYRDRVEVQRRSILPPGKLNGRAAMQQAVERSRGQIITAEPWKSKHRFHTEDPELKVGVMVDISGSMNAAMAPMAVTAWMLSEAVKRVQGKAAMVYYGNDVFPVLAPGQHLDQVTVYSAPDGTERFNKAFKALNGSLDLLGSTGARLLVIVSDMCYTWDEVQATQRWLRRCDQAGVAVLSLPFTSRYHVDECVNGTQTRVLEGRMNPAQAATEIGRAAAEALERAGNRA